MRRIRSMLLMISMVSLLCACSGQEIADMATVVNDDYCAIVWEDRTYILYCAISKSACGEQIGIVDGDKDDRVYEYRGYSAEEWIINSYVRDSAMLYREVDVTSIPDGLESEYQWNNDVSGR